MTKVMACTIAGMIFVAGVASWLIVGLIDETSLPAKAEGASPSLGAAQIHSDDNAGRIAQASPPSQSLPGGASSLQESFQDWSVICVQQGAVKRCTMSQQQSSAQTRQRVLAIELAGNAADKAEGVLVLPFGLSLDAGVALQVDDGVSGPALRFRTCLAAGCIVPVVFDARMLAVLRRAAALKIKATTEGGSPTVLTVSLKGFGVAFDRVLSLR
jgi:invasion protein IalB